MPISVLFQILETARHGFKGYGVELNLWLVLYSRYQAWKNGIKNVKFYRKDLWKVVCKVIDIYFILSSEIMENISVIKEVSIYSVMIWYHLLLFLTILGFVSF